MPFTYGWTQWRSHSYTIFLFIVIVVKHKERFFGGHVKPFKRYLQLMSIEKNTSCGFYTNFKSFIPETYKIGLIKSLLFWCFILCSDFIKFYHEIDKLKSIWYKNSYPPDLVDK